MAWIVFFVTFAVILVAFLVFNAFVLFFLLGGGVLLVIARAIIRRNRRFAEKKDKNAPETAEFEVIE